MTVPFSFHCQQLKTARLLGIVLLSVCLAPLACNRDPALRKQKFFAQGNSDFDQGKFAEAMISYGRALQVDPGFADAHYKLAQTHMKMNSWASAYRELQRTVEIQPTNWKAQVDLGQLELAARKRQEAKDRALAILKKDPNNSDAQILLSLSDAALENMKDALGEAHDAVKMAPDRSLTYL